MKRILKYWLAGISILGLACLAVAATLNIPYTPTQNGLSINDLMSDFTPLYHTSTATDTGLLPNTDWIIFNGKQNALGYTPMKIDYSNADTLPLFSITSTEITNALGYTPYSNANTSNFISNITGLVTQGSNVTITGLGTSVSPYVINSTASGSGAVSYDTAVGVRDISTTSAPYVAMTDMTITDTFTAGHVRIDFNAVLSSYTTATANIEILLDSTVLEASALVNQSTSTLYGICSLFWVTSISAGSHTISIKWNTSGGTPTIYQFGTVYPRILTVTKGGI
jgi:hypothetical protein